MGLDLSYAGLVVFILALARTVAWLMVVPPFSDRHVIPSTATMGVGAGLALLIGPTIPLSSIPTDTASLIISLVGEVLTGLAMGYVINLLLSSLTSAGALIDLSGGLNLPPAVDPLGLDQTPMVGQFYQQVAMLLFFLSNGYLSVIDGFVRSFQGPGYTLQNSDRVATVLITDFATVFSSSVEIAAPILLVLFATQVVLALLSKMAPQMNVWILGMPMQIFLALSLVSLGISVLPTYLGHAIGRAIADTSTMFRGL